ncbi:hypothetical protein ACN42_g11344 [Penicillium freii]|uniref:Uncharacterized protein n=1 Tax=Penicillium freii TaxID=48697 RepID=A0A101M8F1_PENFR|nr:hypothetical protein ACN42_g11344 [Penicillium freii]
MFINFINCFISALIQFHHLEAILAIDLGISIGIANLPAARSCDSEGVNAVVARLGGSHQFLTRATPTELSAIYKPHAGELVVRWVTTSESSLLYVFFKNYFGSFGKSHLPPYSHSAPSPKCPEHHYSIPEYPARP